MSQISKTQALFGKSNVEDRFTNESNYSGLNVPELFSGASHNPINNLSASLLKELDQISITANKEILGKAEWSGFGNASGALPTTTTTTTAAATCPAPTNLQKSGGVGSTTLTWSGVTGSPIEYQVAILPTSSGSDPDMVSPFITSNTSYIYLTVGGPFNWWVRTNCGDGTYTQWVQGPEFSTTSSMGGGGLPFGGGMPMPSDVTFKTNIVKNGVSDSGINIYQFQYVNDIATYTDIINTMDTYQGVIAQELIGTEFEDALVLDENGKYLVDYSKIDVEFKKLN